MSRFDSEFLKSLFDPAIFLISGHFMAPRRSRFQMGSAIRSPLKAGGIATYRHSVTLTVVTPSRRHSSATFVSACKPANTIRIFSAAVHVFRFRLPFV
jgi:hypothetical protein